MDGEPVGFAKAFPTLVADVGLVPRVSADMARQLDGLGEHGVAVLAGVHLPCSDSQGESPPRAGQELCLHYASFQREGEEIVQRTGSPGAARASRCKARKVLEKTTSAQGALNSYRPQVSRGLLEALRAGGGTTRWCSKLAAQLHPTGATVGNTAQYVHYTHREVPSALVGGKRRVCAPVVRGAESRRNISMKNPREIQPEGGMGESRLTEGGGHMAGVQR